MTCNACAFVSSLRNAGEKIAASCEQRNQTDSKNGIAPCEAASRQDLELHVMLMRHGVADGRSSIRHTAAFFGHMVMRQALIAQHHDLPAL